MAESFFETTILDNSVEDRGSTTKLRIVALTSSNYTAWLGLITDLGAAIDGIINGVRATETRVGDRLFLSRTRPSSTEAQREKKWLVVYEDATTHKLYRNEIATADLSLLTSGSDKIIAFPTGPLADFKAAFEAAVLSPVGNAVTLSYLEYVGKRL